MKATQTATEPATVREVAVQTDIDCIFRMKVVECRLAVSGSGRLVMPLTREQRRLYRHYRSFIQAPSSDLTTIPEEPELDRPQSQEPEDRQVRSYVTAHNCDSDLASE